MGNIELALTEQDGGWRVSVRGELDVTTAQEFRTGLEQALDSGDGDILLDLCAVEFIDSTGLHAMLNVHRRLSRQGRGMHVECVSGPVMRLFELARLVETFDVSTGRRTGGPAGGTD